MMSLLVLIAVALMVMFVVRLHQSRREAVRLPVRIRTTRGARRR